MMQSGGLHLASPFAGAIELHANRLTMEIGIEE
jgi:hypothetical protein